MGPLLEAIDWQSVALVLVVLAAVAILGLAKGWWVPGARYNEMRSDRDYWRDKVFESLGLAKEATGIAAEEIGV